MIRDKYGSAQLQANPPVAGDRAYAKFLKGRSNRYLLVTAQATLTISVAVSAILGLGSLWQIFDYIGVDEGGKDFQVDPRFFIALSDTIAPSKRTTTRVTSLSASPVTLREQIMIPFEMLFAAKPGETRFREGDLSVDTQFFYQLNATANGIAKLVTGGTAALSNVTVQVQQYFDNDFSLAGDPTGANAPYFKPFWQQKNITVNASSSTLTVDVDSRDLVAAVTILQNTTGKGMVTDIINKIGMNGTGGDYIGRGQLMNYDEFARGKEFEYGGDVYAGPLGGIVHHNFRQAGRLSNVFNPNQDNTVQLVFDGQPSVVAGAVSSEIRVLFHLLRRQPNQRVQDGVWITSPTLPANLVG